MASARGFSRELHLPPHRSSNLFPSALLSVAHAPCGAVYATFIGEGFSSQMVLGASVLQVSVLINRGFFILLTLAACIALPLAYVSLNALLADVYVDHAPFGLAPFGIAYSLIFATALLTVATQIRRVVRTNPAEVLRNE